MWGDAYITSIYPFHTIYIFQNITLYMINTYNFICSSKIFKYEKQNKGNKVWGNTIKLMWHIYKHNSFNTVNKEKRSLFSLPGGLFAHTLWLISSTDLSLLRYLDYQTKIVNMKQALSPAHPVFLFFMVFTIPDHFFGIVCYLFSAMECKIQEIQHFTHFITSVFPKPNIAPIPK